MHILHHIAYKFTGFSKICVSTNLRFKQDLTNDKSFKKNDNYDLICIFLVAVE